MLVLTRRPGEVIMIGDSIEVTMLAIDGKRIRVGVQAPTEMSVDRCEVRRRKQKEALGSSRAKEINDRLS